jgi:hypothetical protein
LCGSQLIDFKLEIGGPFPRNHSGTEAIRRNGECRQAAHGAASPLHKNVPKAALADPHLYELLVLVDALRDGKARERELAVKELSKRLQGASDGLSQS